jgi:hypothetical protein
MESDKQCELFPLIYSYFVQDLISTVKTYSERLDVTYKVALEYAIKAIEDALSDSFGHRTAILTVHPDHPGRLKRENDSRERRKVSRKKTNMDLEDMSDTGSIAELQQLGKTNSSKQLKQFRQTRKNDYETTINLMKSTQRNFAENPDEAQLFRIFCLPASEAVRFPLNKEMNDIDEASFRLVKALTYTPKESDAKEKKSLAFLNDNLALDPAYKGLAFESNTKTFTDGKFCGTPDAVMIINGVIVSVAEFKSEKTKQTEFEARTQLGIYLYILGLESGWIVFANPKGRRQEQLVLDDALRADLLLRYESFKRHQAQV